STLDKFKQQLVRLKEQRANIQRKLDNILMQEADALLMDGNESVIQELTVAKKDTMDDIENINNIIAQFIARIAKLEGEPKRLSISEYMDSKRKLSVEEDTHRSNKAPRFDEDHFKPSDLPKFGHLDIKDPEEFIHQFEKTLKAYNINLDAQ